MEYLSHHNYWSAKGVVQWQTTIVCYGWPNLVLWQPCFKTGGWTRWLVSTSISTDSLTFPCFARHKLPVTFHNYPFAYSVKPIKHFWLPNRENSVLILPLACSILQKPPFQVKVPAGTVNQRSLLLHLWIYIHSSLTGMLHQVCIWGIFLANPFA